MERKKRVPITEELSKKIMQLSVAGFNKTQIGKLLNVSDAAAGNVIRSGGWEGYLKYKRACAELNRIRVQKKNEREAEAKQAWEAAEAEATKPVRDEPTMEDIIEQLKEINIKLDQMISIWVNTDKAEEYKDNSYKPF